MRDVRRFTSASAALLHRMIDGYGRRSETNMRAGGVDNLGLLTEQIQEKGADNLAPAKQ